MANIGQNNGTCCDSVSAKCETVNTNILPRFTSSNDNGAVQTETNQTN